MCINGKVIATSFDNNAERNENDDRIKKIFFLCEINLFNIIEEIR